MEKHGVCPGEGDEVQAGGITRKDVEEAIKKTAGDTGNKPACGEDAMSKAAEAAATPPRKKA